jgi:hypothetical protein
MSLRFAIIKGIKTLVGSMEEDVVYEWGEDYILEKIMENFKLLLPEKKDPHFGKKTWTRPEFVAAFDAAYRKTISDFKKITIRIL